MGHGTGKAAKQSGSIHSWWKKSTCRKTKKKNYHSQADLKAILMEQCDEDVV